MTDATEEARVARRARHEAILAEVALEEAEAAEAESAEKASTLDTPLHLRIDRELDAQLRRRAVAEHIPTSALVRRLLRQTVHERYPGALSAVEVEDIARRVVREELLGSAEPSERVGGATSTTILSTTTVTPPHHTPAGDQ